NKGAAGHAARGGARAARADRRRRIGAQPRPTRRRTGVAGSAVGSKPQSARGRGADMKVLITGGGGFVGSHLADAFIARGDEVFILDTGSVIKTRHLMGQPAFHYIRDSIFNVEILEGLVTKCDLIYHLAAVVGVEHYVGDPYEVLNVNVNGTQNVLKLAF